jgi:hypothetical protein
MSDGREQRAHVHQPGWLPSPGEIPLLDRDGDLGRQGHDREAEAISAGREASHEPETRSERRWVELSLETGSSARRSIGVAGPIRTSALSTRKDLSVRTRRADGEGHHADAP